MGVKGGCSRPALARTTLQREDPASGWARELLPGHSCCGAQVVAVALTLGPPPLLPVCG